MEKTQQEIQTLINCPLQLRHTIYREYIVYKELY
jgi:hypothetical protein